MARILVTGGEGFIGRALVRSLQQHHEVQVLSRADGDIAESSTLASLPLVDHVFHLAARTYVPESWVDPLGFTRVNVDGTMVVADYCRRSSAALTYVSAYIYGQPESLPVGEGAPIRPNNPYALSKHLAEQVCEFHARYYGVRTTVIRPFNVYGPNQAAQFLVPSILRQVRTQSHIELADLEPRRDFVYVDDLVDALRKTIAGAADPYRVFNIGSGHSISVGELVEVIQSVAGTRLPVSAASQRRVQEIPDVRADISFANSALGWCPRITLEEGIRRIMSATGQHP